MEILAALLGAVVGGILTGLASWLTIRWQLKVESELREKEKVERISALVSALYHELDSVWKLYMQSTGQEIEKVPPVGQPQAFLTRYPIISDYFPVYQANAGDIGLIPDASLRNKLVEAYTLAKSLIDSYKMNNQLIQESMAARIRYYDSVPGGPPSTADAEKQMQHAERVLNDYGPKLRVLHLKCKEKAEALLKQLETR